MATPVEFSPRRKALHWFIFLVLASSWSVTLFNKGAENGYAPIVRVSDLRRANPPSQY